MGGLGHCMTKNFVNYQQLPTKIETPFVQPVAYALY
jgi:hypothetical protein